MGVSKMTFVLGYEFGVVISTCGISKMLSVLSGQLPWREVVFGPQIRLLCLHVDSYELLFLDGKVVQLVFYKEFIEKTSKNNRLGAESWNPTP